MDDLPEEILLNIFHRLPTKVLGNCMCAKKQYYSLIKNSSFVTVHTARTNDNKIQYLMFRLNENDLHLHLDDSERFWFYKRYTIPLGVTDHSNTPGVVFCHGLLACNGVICLIRDDSSVALWNPAIRRMLMLPPPIFRVRQDRQRLGFAYDSLSNDYKVVVIDFLNQHTQIYSLKNHSWKLLPQNTDTFRHNFWGLNLLIANGNVHWFGSNYGVPGNCSIWGLNVHTETFHELPLPTGFNQDTKEMNLSVYKQNSIALYCMDLEFAGVIEVWAMIEYGNIESWSKIWTFDAGLVMIRGTPVGSPEVMLVRNNGQVIVRWSHPLFDYIVSMGRLQSDQPRLIPLAMPMLRSCNCIRYLEESLILLDNPLAFVIW